VCDLCSLNPAVLVVSGLSEVLGALGQILLSYLVHMHSCLRSLRQGQVHVGPITWEVLPHTPVLTYLSNDIIETWVEPTTRYNPSLHILRLKIYLFVWTSTVHPVNDN
jgi:hypothetical protein